jgi:hypothetical protein
VQAFETRKLALCAKILKIFLAADLSCDGMCMRIATKQIYLVVQGDSSSSHLQRAMHALLRARVRALRNAAWRVDGNV